MQVAIPKKIPKSALTPEQLQVRKPNPQMIREMCMAMQIPCQYESRLSGFEQSRWCPWRLLDVLDTALANEHLGLEYIRKQCYAMWKESLMLVTLRGGHDFVAQLLGYPSMTAAKLAQPKRSVVIRRTRSTVTLHKLRDIVLKYQKD